MGQEVTVEEIPEEYLDQATEYREKSSRSSC
jgi:hypothetical protein